jgi:hypothetical protein
MKFIKIGDRIINLDEIVHATWEPARASTVKYKTQAGIETRDIRIENTLTISFGCEELQIFYGAEADAVWRVLSDLALVLATAPFPVEALPHG